MRLCLGVFFTRIFYISVSCGANITKFKHIWKVFPFWINTFSLNALLKDAAFSKKQNKKKNSYTWCSRPISDLINSKIASRNSINTYLVFLVSKFDAAGLLRAPQHKMIIEPLFCTDSCPNLHVGTWKDTKKSYRYAGIRSIISCIIYIYNWIES